MSDNYKRKYEKAKRASVFLAAVIDKMSSVSGSCSGCPLERLDPPFCNHGNPCKEAILRLAYYDDAKREKILEQHVGEFDLEQFLEDSDFLRGGVNAIL